MTEILYVRKDSLQPYYKAKIEDSSKSAVDLTGATVAFTMRAPDGSVKINEQTAGIVVTDAAAGEVDYHWQAGDTDTAGDYKVEFLITPASGDPFVMPAKPNEEARVVIY